ncbi:MAG: PA2779 family protein [Terriglobia bacterium]
MLSHTKRLLVLIFTCSFALLLVTQSLHAQEYVVPASTLHQALMSSAAVRKNNIRKVETFLSSKRVQNVARKSGYDLKEVKQAVPSLSDQELARLAKTTQATQSDFAAGALSHEEVAGIIVVAAIVVIILAIKA